MADPRYPSLYQSNSRVWLTELSRKKGDSPPSGKGTVPFRVATLDDIPDAELDRLAELGFDWVWFLSVWQTGLAGQRVSRANAGVAGGISRDAAGPAGRGHRRFRFCDHRL